MTTATLSAESIPDPSAEPGSTPAPPVLDIVIPVYNEEDQLEATIRRLDEHLRRHLPYSYRICVADNASTDSTTVIARRLSRQLSSVRIVRLEEKGRGRALSRVWGESDAEVLVYMDVDLSTDLKALLPLVAPLISGHSDLAIGSRLARGSHVVRGPKREIISRGYNLVLRGTLAARFTDAQCGFKAIRRDVAQRLLPMVADTGWFFDTELLVLAEKAGLRIHEVPVDWVDDPGSRVDILATAVADLKGVVRVGRALATGRIPLRDITGPTSRTIIAETTPAGLVPQLIRFVGVGVVSTLAYLLLFFLLRQGMSAQSANFAALLVTTVLNTAANRRLTFGVTGSRGATRHQLQGLAVFALGLGLTSGSLLVLQAQSTARGQALEAFVLIAANLAATALRFILLRAWVFRPASALQTTGSTR
jgi:putative flippase GtrA